MLFIILKNLVFFILLYMLLRMISKKINKQEEQAEEQNAEADRSSLIVEVEQVEHKGEVIFLGFGVYEGRFRRFVSQGFSLQEMLVNAFTRFPGKKVIFWFNHGLTSIRESDLIMVKREDVLTTLKENCG